MSLSLKEALADTMVVPSIDGRRALHLRKSPYVKRSVRPETVRLAPNTGRSNTDNTLSLVISSPYLLRQKMVGRCVCVTVCV